jgi:hypothetical protein
MWELLTGKVLPFFSATIIHYVNCTILNRVVYWFIHLLLADSLWVPDSIMTMILVVYVLGQGTWIT